MNWVDFHDLQPNWARLIKAYLIHHSEAQTTFDSYLETITILIRASPLQTPTASVRFRILERIRPGQFSRDRRQRYAKSRHETPYETPFCF
jgi:hypothetical protein